MAGTELNLSTRGRSYPTNTMQEFISLGLRVWFEPLQRVRGQADTFYLAQQHSSTVFTQGERDLRTEDALVSGSLSYLRFGGLDSSASYTLFQGGAGVDRVKVIDSIPYQVLRDVRLRMSQPFFFRLSCDRTAPSRQGEGAPRWIDTEAGYDELVTEAALERFWVYAYQCDPAGSDVRFFREYLLSPDGLRMGDALDDVLPAPLPGKFPQTTMLPLFRAHDVRKPAVYLFYASRVRLRASLRRDLAAALEAAALEPVDVGDPAEFVWQHPDSPGLGTPALAVVEPVTVALYLHARFALALERLHEHQTARVVMAKRQVGAMFMQLALGERYPDYADLEKFRSNPDPLIDAVNQGLEKLEVLDDFKGDCSCRMVSDLVALYTTEYELQTEMEDAAQALIERVLTHPLLDIAERAHRQWEHDDQATYLREYSGFTTPLLEVHDGLEFSWGRDRKCETNGGLKYLRGLLYETATPPWLAAVKARVFDRPLSDHEWCELLLTPQPLGKGAPLLGSVNLGAAMSGRAWAKQAISGIRATRTLVVAVLKAKADTSEDGRVVWGWIDRLNSVLMDRSGGGPKPLQRAAVGWRTKLWVPQIAPGAAWNARLAATTGWHDFAGALGATLGLFETAAKLSTELAKPESDRLGQTVVGARVGNALASAAEAYAKAYLQVPDGMIKETTKKAVETAAKRISVLANLFSVCAEGLELRRVLRDYPEDYSVIGGQALATAGAAIGLWGAWIGLAGAAGPVGAAVLLAGWGVSFAGSLLLGMSKDGALDRFARHCFWGAGWNAMPMLNRADADRPTKRSARLWEQGGVANWPFQDPFIQVRALAEILAGFEVRGAREPLLGTGIDVTFGWDPQALPYSPPKKDLDTTGVPVRIYYRSLPYGAYFRITQEWNVRERIGPVLLPARTRVLQRVFRVYHQPHGLQVFDAEGERVDDGFDHLEHNVAERYIQLSEERYHSIKALRERRNLIPDELIYNVDLVVPSELRELPNELHLPGKNRGVPFTAWRREKTPYTLYPDGRAKSTDV